MLKFTSGFTRWLLPSVMAKMLTAFWTWAWSRFCSSWIMPLGNVSVNVRISRARPVSPVAVR